LITEACSSNDTSEAFFDGFFTANINLSLPNSGRGGFWFFFLVVKIFYGFNNFKNNIKNKKKINFRGLTFYPPFSITNFNTNFYYFLRKLIFQKL
jgi:hypothetical protein